LTVENGHVLSKGTALYLTGRALTRRGAPVADALVEIWQCDANAVYHHPAGGAENERDPNFQGYGQTTTDATGAFHFRTIRPVPYPGRTAHIHVRVQAKGLPALPTQLYVDGDAGNARDFLYRRLDEAERAALTLRLQPTTASHPLAQATQLTAMVDLVIG
jgi:protocatechuate 3,4-dioxygenase beta subunit